MVKKTVYMALLAVVAASFVGACSADEMPQKTSAKIDARMLLAELGDMLKEMPDTEEKCQAKLEALRDWQRTKLVELMNQPKSVKYDFECPWVAQEYEDSQACTKVLFSGKQTYRAVEGGSLEMAIDLVDGDKHKSSGEAFVDMRKYPPVGEHVPVDMRGRTISAFVYAPWGARGTPDSPNGFQVFAKSQSADDDVNECRYGPWYNAREAEWREIKLKVSRDPPRIEDGEVMTPGFDPNQIVIVGVKMGAGKKGYKGPVFVDAISW